jgi:CubicO group peptidase (beta-lactamase class C family)
MARLRIPLFLFMCTLLPVQIGFAGNWNSSGKSADTSAGFNNKLPEGSSPTLKQMQLTYITYFSSDFRRPGDFVEPSTAPKNLKFAVVEDGVVEKEFQNSGLMSYIVYRNGQVVVDAKSPEDRLGKLIKDDTPLSSQSVGKSFTSYLLGHAICGGYITNLDQTISDWPLMKGTLYENQSLINLVNMRGGDSHLFRNADVLFKNTDDRKIVNHRSMRYWAHELQGTKPKTSLFSKQPQFHYTGFLSNLVLNYVSYKTGDSFEKILNDVFVEKAGIANPVKVGRVDLDGPDEDGPYRGTFFATRYDYLRIALAMLSDWQSDNCVGKYLKELYERRVTNLPNSDNGHRLFRAKTHRYGKSYDYGGYFHSNPAGSKGMIFVMHGYGGQIVAINFDTGTIVSAHSVHEDWDTASLVIDAVNK